MRVGAPHLLPPVPLLLALPPMQRRMSSLVLRVMGAGGAQVPSYTFDDAPSPMGRPTTTWLASSRISAQQLEAPGVPPDAAGERAAQLADTSILGCIQ